MVPVSMWPPTITEPSSGIRRFTPSISAPERSALCDGVRGARSGQARRVRKPLAMSRGEAQSCRVGGSDGVRNATCHSVTTRWFRLGACVKRGSSARSYCARHLSQDWFLYETDWKWRVEAKDEARCESSVTRFPLVRHGRACHGAADPVFLCRSRNTSQNTKTPRVAGAKPRTQSMVTVDTEDLAP